MNFVQDHYTSDCDLIPHCTDTTNGVTVVSFTSATHNVVNITIQQDRSIGVSTETHEDNIDTQFRIFKYVSMYYLL